MQPFEHRFDPVVHAPAAVVFERLLQLRQFVEALCIAAGHCQRAVVVGLQGGGPGAQPSSHGVEHAAGASEVRLLRDVGEAAAGLTPDFAVVERLQTRQRLHQARLALAVAADQRDFFAGFENQFGAVEQGDVAIGEMGIGELENGHRCGQVG